MNANENAVQFREPGFIPAVEPQEWTSQGVSVEPQEFERLLQRAMEVLAARSKRAKERFAAPCQVADSAAMMRTSSVE
jgi:hypothetical protein